MDSINNNIHWLSFHRRTIFIGPPGSGKGTHAFRSMKALGIKHLSTGDMLRAAAHKKTPMGLQAQALMDKGQLVSDDLVAHIVSEAICQPDCAAGFILDGFPRTLAQAVILDKLLAEHNMAIDAVVSLLVDDEQLVKRITGRQVHAASGRSYNIYFSPSKKAGVDDFTGEPLSKRGDDTEEKLRTRLHEFHSKTEPVLDHYRDRLINVDAAQEIDVISEEINGALVEVLQKKMHGHK